MPPRLQPCGHCLRGGFLPPTSGCRYLSLQSHAPSSSTIPHSVPQPSHYPSTQPPSHRPPELRRSQLHRQYASLLRSSPLMLLFQHNNLKAIEWMGIRRELATALRKVDELAIVAGQQDAELGKGIKIQIIKSGVFGAALRVVEYFDPSTKPNMPLSAAQTSSHLSHKPPPPAANPLLSHGLSRTAHNAVVKKKRMHPMAPLLAGPLAIVTFPAVSTAHLKAVLSILAPHAPAFPAPTRRANPSYYDLGVQAGLQKLLLLGARVEGQVFDLEGTRWVGGIEGGLDGLRGQLVALLQGVGAGVTGTLEAMSKTLYLTIDGRRSVLEEGEKEEQEKTDA